MKRPLACVVIGAPAPPGSALSLSNRAVRSPPPILLANTASKTAADGSSQHGSARIGNKRAPRRFHLLNDISQRTAPPLVRAGQWIRTGSIHHQGHEEHEGEAILGDLRDLGGGKPIRSSAVRWVVRASLLRPTPTESNPPNFSKGSPTVYCRKSETRLSSPHEQSCASAWPRTRAPVPAGLTHGEGREKYPSG